MRSGRISPPRALEAVCGAYLSSGAAGYLHIVTSPVVCWDINHFVHVARPWSSLEAPTARFDSRGYQVDGRLRLRVEGAGRYSSNSLPQLLAVERLPTAKNEVWILASDPRRRPEGDQGRCTGCVRRERARPSPSVTVDLVCLVGAGYPRCSRRARSRRARLVPSDAAGGGARPGCSIELPGG